MNASVHSQFWDARYSRRSAIGLLGEAGAMAAIATSQLTSRSAAALDVNRSPGTADLTNHMEDSNMVTSKENPNSEMPTVVLVHGAFADSSSWDGVIARLLESGVSVTAAPNPLRGVAHDSAYVAGVVEQIPGPVLLVGHSYGGVVITNAGSSAKNVVGLVYVAGLAPDEGESLGALETDSKDSVLITALIPTQFPTEGSGAATATEFSIDPAKIQEAFAADLSTGKTAIMAATQRPIAEAAFSEPTGVPAWKSLPTWAIVPTSDKAAGSDVVRATAERAGATIVEIDGSHVVMMSQPQAVTDVILSALEAVA